LYAILYIVHYLYKKVFNFHWCTVQTWRSRCSVFTVRYEMDH